jgi:hypothetical protein
VLAVAVDGGLAPGRAARVGDAIAIEAVRTLNPFLYFFKLEAPGIA